VFRSIIFETPFGTHLDRPLETLAPQLLRAAPRTTLWSLLQHPLRYLIGDFARRGCVWWDGHTFGSSFVGPIVAPRFVPPFKSRYRGVPPFLLYGFVPGSETERPDAFCVCDLWVWRSRVLLSVPYAERDFLLRTVLATLVDNQPVQFLKERRLQLPVFLPFPASREERRRIHESGNDVYVVDETGNVRVWCPFWLDT